MKLYLLFVTILFFSKSLFALEATSTFVDVTKIRDFFTKESILTNSITDSRRELYYTMNQVEPFQRIRHISKYQNTILFDRTYNIGELGLREIEPKLYSTKATKHLIIAGDSNTFGIGVTSENTLPVLLTGIKKDYHPYNFGIRGGAPHCTLGLMEFFPWEMTIQESSGYFIYNYYDFLIDRVVGSKGYIAWNDGNSPNYQLNDNNEAEYVGDFRDRFITKIYQSIMSVKWLDQLLPTLPRHRLHHSILVSKIFLKMQQNYLSKFPNGKFVVAINYSFPEMVPGRLEELRQELQNNHIAYIILPKKDFGENFKLADGHLSEAGHKSEADLIVKDLPLL